MIIKHKSSNNKQSFPETGSPGRLTPTACRLHTVQSQQDKIMKNTPGPKPFTGEEKKQLFHFSLYGFLKNQRYWEPFLVLALRDKGLSFTSIGLLFGLREIFINLMEVPSGAMADVWGRRKSMILSMLSYMVSFIIFAFAENFSLLAVAMFCFSIGEVFRTGTHKAMIFDWLIKKNRPGEKTRVYGITRSWSKQGTSIMAILAALIVILTSNYRLVFLLSCIPYAMNIVNFLMYPSWLDRSADSKQQKLPGIRVIISGFNLLLTRKSLRNLAFQSVLFEGMHKAAKEYIQPLLKVAALAIPLQAGMSSRSRTGLLIGVVWFFLGQAESMASRASHTAQKLSGSKHSLALRLWLAMASLYILSAAGLYLDMSGISIAGFLGLMIIQNLWRPAQVSRFSDCAEISSAATTLSIESQAKSLFAAVLMPVLGLMVDSSGTPGNMAISLPSLLPVTVAGIIAAFAGLWLNHLGNSGQSMKESATESVNGNADQP